MDKIVNITERLITQLDQFLSKFDTNDEIKAARDQINKDRDQLKDINSIPSALKMRDTLHSLWFTNKYMENILVFEKKIVAEYDSLNNYTTFDTLFDSKMKKEQRNMALLKNVRVIQSMPTEILNHVTIIPDIELSFGQL